MIERLYLIRFPDSFIAVIVSTDTSQYENKTLFIRVRINLSDKFVG